MTLQRVGARLMSGGDAVVDMAPMVGCGVARIDAGGLGRVDRGEHLANLGPAFDLEQDVAARPHERQRREGLVGADRTLRAGELLLLNPDHADSMDGRYFGPLLASTVLGRAIPILTRDTPDAPLTWR